MKVAAFIPARLQSERFPGKLLKNLKNKPVILHTWENMIRTRLFDQVWVITDSDEIEKVIKQAGGTVKRSKKTHPSGTDRIAEYASETDTEIIINVQGDEPFVHRELLQKIIETFENDTQKKLDIVSLMKPISNKEDFYNPNRVKVVTDNNRFAMYFSRAPVPFPRDGNFEKAFVHIGIYAFRKNILEKISRLEQSDLEKIEKLENLRFLQAGFRIKMIEIQSDIMGIDTPEDLIQAEKKIRNGEI